MKFKKDLILLGIMVIVAACVAGITVLCGGGGTEKKSGNLQITASFYPMYIIALNLTQGMEDINVDCMTQNQTGCLHDYQMTTQDMKTLEHTDAFIINGGGMESFLEDVVENYPSLTVMNAGKNLEDIAEELEHAHIHEPETEKEEQNGDKTEQKEEIHGLENNIEENGHNHEEEANAHFWLNPEYYIIQIQTVADELSAFDSEHAAKYQQNAEAYIKKVEKLATQLKALNVPNTGAIVFHDAFVYLAEYLGLEVIRTIEIDSETALSAGDIAEIIEEIKKGQVSILFTEAQYSTEAADTISKETGVSSYTIDSLVTGENNKDAYLTGMEKNIAILKNAFSGND